jgi:hypothetical protein
MRTLIILLALSLLSFNSDAGVKRSWKARSEFKANHACPSTGKTKGPCPGYIIDHIEALACGGADMPYNMQWQTVEAAKAKDKWERKGCKRGMRTR